MSTETGIYNVVIGTAGHIDHGKSSIVKRLTGIDPDRLPEEKEREMTIDLGFAPMTLKNGMRIGLIDVPGHEKFVKNMLAGATGIDIAMLVVSAYEGIMLQTREHLNIMRLLGLKRGFIVLNKIDMVDQTMVELVEDEVKKMVMGTFLENARILRVSAITGEGFDKLIEHINNEILKTEPKNTEGVFRMPIQRIFASKGFGTVITGVPVSGSLKIGDVIEILPLNKTARVKGFQAYKAQVNMIRAGHSSAINISDITYQEIQRGYVAATPGYFKSVNQLEALFTFLPEEDIVLESYSPIKFHSGTKEADGVVVILDKPTLAKSAEGLIQIRLDEPVTVAEGDRFILRRQTPMITLGGGTIVDTSGKKQKRFSESVVDRLSEKFYSMEDKAGFIAFSIKDSGFKFTDAKEISVKSRADIAEVNSIVEKLSSESQLVFSKDKRFIHKETLGKAEELVVKKIETFHKEKPLKFGQEKLALKQTCEKQINEELFPIILSNLESKGAIKIENNRVKLATFEVRLSKEENKLAMELETLVVNSGFHSPDLKSLHEHLSKYERQKVDKVCEMLIDSGTLLLLKDGILMHKNHIEQAKSKIIETIQRQGHLETAQFKDIIGSSRKYAVPILEYFDGVGLTYRVDNKRFLKK